MLKLFIADDEQIVIDSLQFIVEKYIEDAVVVGWAKSGRESIEKVEVLKPDVVLMDIRMPGINGLEAIREIKKRHQEIVFIILTAYENFNFAQEAVNLGVMEYLLKPINKNKVIEVIKKAGELVNQQRRAILKEIELKEKLKKIMPHIEAEFVYSLFFDSQVVKNLPFYEEIFEMPLEYGYVMLMAIGNNDQDGEEKIEASLDKYELCLLFREWARDTVKCLVGPLMLNRVIVYVPVSKEVDEYTLRNSSIEVALRVTDRLQTMVDLPYCVGIGSPYPIENFLKSYEEADRAIKLAKGEKILHYRDLNLAAKPPDFYPLHKEKTLIDKILVGDMEAARGVFEEIFHWLTLNYVNNIDEIKIRLLELVVVMMRLVSYHGGANVLNGQKDIAELLNLNDFRDLKLYFLNRLNEMVEQLKTCKSREINEVITKAVRFINANYARNITLNDVAREVNMSYHYFSKLFKDETGQNFSDYLMELRMRHAREFLKNEGLSIKDVSSQVGYQDPNYFTKIFKKVFGITPTEYREKFIIFHKEKGGRL